MQYRRETDAMPIAKTLETRVLTDDSRHLAGGMRSIAVTNS